MLILNVLPVIVRILNLHGFPIEKNDDEEDGVEKNVGMVVGFDADVVVLRKVDGFKNSFNESLVFSSLSLFGVNDFMILNITTCIYIFLLFLCNFWAVLNITYGCSFACALD